MKRFICAILSIILVAISFTACGEGGAENLKLGMGIYSYIDKAADADGETNGKAQVVATVAAVLLDSEGKVVSCQIDVADNTVNFTSEGKYVDAEVFKTKYEYGDTYGMKAYGGATLEWYEQVDAFEKVVIGKKLDEIKALVAGEKKGNSEVITAGCTIMVEDFVLALEKAINNATDSAATAENTLKIGVVTEFTGKDASEEKPGDIKLETYCVASVTNDSKVIATVSDCVQSNLNFTTVGETLTEVGGEPIKTKKEQGDAYGMGKYGADINEDGTVLEWYAQAAAFDAACIGKSAGEISGLMTESGYGNESLMTAGCTIGVMGLVGAAVKAA